MGNDERFTTTRQKAGRYVVTDTITEETVILYSVGKPPNWKWFAQRGESVSVPFSTKRAAKDFAIESLSKGEFVTASQADNVDDYNDTVDEKTDIEVIEEQRMRFKAIRTMSRMTMTGLNRGLIISGPAGVGKTYDIQMMAEELYDIGDIDYSMIKGYTRPLGLYQLLYQNRFENNVVVFDDCDSVFSDEAGLNLLKAALDTTSKRIISWNTKAVENISVEVNGETEPLPRDFEFCGSIIFLTNIDFDRLIAKDNKMSPHFQALVSRCHYIDCGMHTKRERLLRVADVCNGKAKMLMVQCGLKEDVSRAVIDWMAVNLENLREVSLRSALKIGLLAAGDPEGWKEMAKITALK